MSAVLNLDNAGQLVYDHAPFDNEFDHAYALRDAMVIANNCGHCIGSGSYGQVYEIANTNQVLKICFTRNLKRDGYHSYLKMLMTRSNPFFPKVDRFIKYKSNDTYDKCIVYGVRMEKLMPLEKLDKDVVHKMGEDLFSDFTTSPRYDYGRGPCSSLMMAIKEATIYQQYGNVKNPYLIEAMQIIALLMKTGDFINDMGGSNFMVRPDSLPHLVITDPIA